MTARKLTPAMVRELRAMHTTGEPSDPCQWHHCGGLWFYARDRVIGALLRRELIEDNGGGYVLTAAGLAALNQPE